MLGHYRPASETPFKGHFAGGPMMARLKWYFDPPSHYQLKNKKEKKRCQSCTPSGITFLIRAWHLQFRWSGGEDEDRYANL